jgi:hypothetical protein
MHAHRGQPVPDRRPDPVSRSRASQAQRWQERAVTYPRSAPGPPDGCRPLRGGEAGQQVEDLVPALDLGTYVQSAGQV